MKPVKQQIILVDQTHNTIMVESAKGNRYNVDLNHYCGDINVGDTVCIIEAMKLMNEIESDVSGRIVEVLVNDGDPVEYGMPLFAIE